MTWQERRLWSRLRRRQVDGHRFRRQAPVGPYVVDFLCVATKLVVEVDGEIHDWRSRDDSAREMCLRAMGYRVLRVKNYEVELDLNSVVARVAAMLGG